MESNGHSPLTNMRNPLNQAYLDAQPADLRGQINMISGYHHDTNSRQGHGRGKKNQGVKQQRVPMPMSRTVISDIIYPVQTKKGLKWGKNQRAAPQATQSQHQIK